MRTYSDEKLITMLQHRHIEDDIWFISLEIDGWHVTVQHKIMGREIMNIHKLKQLLYGENGEEIKTQLQELFTQLEIDCFWKSELNNILEEDDV